MTPIPWLDPDSLLFPDPSTARKDPDGLLAVGGDLSPQRILVAYQQGIFPWFNSGDPILWWSPDPRTVIYPNQLHLSRSLRKTLRKKIYRVTFDSAFEQVMRNCAAPRRNANGTWISEEIIAAYVQLHQLGFAHSVEVWRDDGSTPILAGGLYGIALGRVFFGESMFSNADNASKVGLAHLVRQLDLWQFAAIDCQVASEHLFTLGAIEIPRKSFQQILLDFVQVAAVAPITGDWTEIQAIEW